jgi:hypothetical protein
VVISPPKITLLGPADGLVGIEEQLTQRVPVMPGAGGSDCRSTRLERGTVDGTRLQTLEVAASEKRIRALAEVDVFLPQTASP